jgi:hypothetical protein
MERPRPDEFDYTQPDHLVRRCMNCNRNGMNRTGLRLIGHIGTTTTGYYGIRCEKLCDNGLKKGTEVLEVEIESIIKLDNLNEDKK